MFEAWTNCHECEHYDSNDRLCKLFRCVKPCGCPNGTERKPRNNFERLKSMSMEQFAVWLTAVRLISKLLCVNPFDDTGNDYNKWLEWLKEEVDDCE